MTGGRCPDCEAIITELECQDCVAHAANQAASLALQERALRRPAATRTHCPAGHEMTDANSRVDVRLSGGKGSVSRACRACHNARCAARRARRNAEREAS
jgi:hypothetical protein